MRHAIDFSRSILPLHLGPQDCVPSSDNHDGALAEAVRQHDNGLLSLRQILPQARFFCGDDVRFYDLKNSDDVREDTNQIRQSLLVYRLGIDDPEDVIAEALAHGAAGILTEQALPCPLPQCIVADVDQAAAAIRCQQLDRPDRRLLTIGVVGGDGKTSTALLIGQLLRDCGVRSGYQTDLGSCDGIVQVSQDVSAASGESLVRWLDEVCDCESEAAIIELTSHDVRLGHYDAIEFDLLIITGAASSQQDFGPCELQCALERLASGGVVVVSADDNEAKRAVIDSGVRRVEYGLTRQADVTAKIVENDCGMMTLMLQHDDTSAFMETPLCGHAMAANVLAAATVGILVGEPLHRVADSLGKLRQIPGRGQRLSTIDHAEVVIDAAGSTSRARRAIEDAKAGMAKTRHFGRKGRLWCLLALDDSSDPDELAGLGSLLERHGDHAVLSCRRELKPGFLKAAHGVLDGAQDCASLRLVADLERAVRWTVRSASANDTILIMGNLANRTPHAQRTLIQELEQWVASEQKSMKRTGANAQPTLTPGSTDTAQQPVKLRIVG
ncbi:MAG: Mur ligase family protein [Planctomycetota bacterium]